MKKIYVIIGSTRPGKIGAAVGEWFMEVAKETGRTDVEFVLVDLSDWDLPLLDEPVPAMRSNAYLHEHTKLWSHYISQADAFILISAEHNNSIPASLKNALDYLYQEWTQKPVAFVTYGWGAGRNARRHLADIVHKLDMNLVDENVAIQFHPGMFGAGHQIATPKQTFAQYSDDARAIIKAITTAISTTATST